MAYQFSVTPTPDNSSVAAINAARAYAGVAAGGEPYRVHAISGENWQRQASGEADADLAETTYPPASYIPELTP